jgi:hypothetical protein
MYIGGVEACANQHADINEVHRAEESSVLRYKVSGILTHEFQRQAILVEEQSVHV